MQKTLKKEGFNDFINSLIRKYEVIAPVKKEDGNTRFEIIKNANEIYPDELTLVPAKEFFLPAKETILEFKNKKAIETIPKAKKRIIFGLRKCDLNALRVLDKVMFDQNYIERRKNTIVIGLFCENPDDYCFCESMELEEPEKISDLFFWQTKEGYQISVYSKKGESLVRDLPESKNEIKLKYRNRKKLPSKEISKHYQNKLWEKDAEKCLSCGACTSWCPTCNCFNLRDEMDADLINGRRIREGASCQLKSFSRVAGGKVFRDSRLSRFKHFVYHKVDYFKKKHDRYMCVGCGRCIRICPTKIDWVETINTLNKK